MTKGRDKMAPLPEWNKANRAWDLTTEWRLAAYTPQRKALCSVQTAQLFSAIYILWKKIFYSSSVAG